jgi:cellulose synthase/poly-beta-1,6-N-acetylglucosamine synthase-like glycosyltransferase
MRALFNQNAVQAVRYAADGASWCLIGRCFFARKEIFEDAKFQQAFTHEHFQGTLQNTGDDCFITRWLLNHGWKTVVQNAPEAELTTEIKADSQLLLRMIRWQRSSVQSFWLMLREQPGAWQLWK